MTESSKAVTLGQQVEVRVENGFTFYRPKYKKDWYASGTEICRLFGVKDSKQRANRIWTRFQKFLEHNSCVIEIPTAVSKKDGVDSTSYPFSAENMQQVRCYNRPGSWLFTSKLNTVSSSEMMMQLFDAFDAILKSGRVIRTGELPIDWTQARQDGKAQRRVLTDPIQLFVEYAKDSGSQNAEWYYKTITQKINKLLFDVHGKGTPDDFRNNLSRVELSILGIVEDRVAEHLICCMDSGLEYHASVAGFDGIVTNARSVLTYSRAKELQQIKE
jgi:hypothetical protein